MFGLLIRARPHLSVAGFEREGVGSEPLEVFEFALTGETREDVVDAVEDPSLREVHEERKKIGAAALDFDMVAFGDAVSAEVEFRTAGHSAGDFFAEEEVGAATKDFDGVNGVVVSDGNDRHAETLCTVVYVPGFVIRLIAKVADEGSCDPAGCFGMDVKVASHGKSMEGRYEQSMKRWKNVHECIVATY